MIDKIAIIGGYPTLILKRRCKNCKEKSIVRIPVKKHSPHSRYMLKQDYLGFCGNCTGELEYYE